MGPIDFLRGQSFTVKNNGNNEAYSRVIDVSSVYETVPRGLKEQPNFFNLAILIESELNPSQLKQHLIDPIEKSLNRIRKQDKNAPRTIDLDIVLYGEQVMNYEGDDGHTRYIPDPDLLQYAHVAVPIAELAPELIHPITGQSIARIAQNLIAGSADNGERILESDIFIYDLQKKKSNNLTQTPDKIEMYPDWSSDGSMISYHTDKGRIELLDLKVTLNEQ